MKSAALVPVLLAVSSLTAFGQPTPATQPSPPAADIPDACKAVATAPPSATIPMPGLVAKVSLAYCGAHQRFAALKLAPDDASIAALNDAAKPSFALLDEVLGTDDPIATAMARQLRRSLLVGMAVRMRDSIGSITPTTVGQQLADLMKQHDDLEPKIKPWLDTAKM